MKLKQPFYVICIALLMVSGLLVMVVIPPVASAAGGANTPNPVSHYLATATPSADGALYHTVLEGQNPYMIAELYGIDIDSLLTKNNLDYSSIINIGDVLLIRTASERLPGEVVDTSTLTPMANEGNQTGQSNTAGSLGNGNSSAAASTSLGAETSHDLGAATEGEQLAEGLGLDSEGQAGANGSYALLQAQLIQQFSQSGQLVNLANTPIAPEMAMSAAQSGDAYIRLPSGETGMRTATAVAALGVPVMTLGEHNNLAIPAIQAVALSPDAQKLIKSAAETPNLVERIFSNNTKYLALAVILMVLIGLLLLVISARRLRE